MVDDVSSVESRQVATYRLICGAQYSDSTFAAPLDGIRGRRLTPQHLHTYSF